MGLFDRKKPDANPNPYSGLRQQVLTLEPARVGLVASPANSQVFAGLMEMGLDAGSATLVVIADGTTSMYWSTGGGIIGAGMHEAVKGLSRAFLAALDRHVSEMSPDVASHPTPASGMTHLRARTFGSGWLFVAAPDDDFGKKRHPLWDAFYAAHAVITAMRQLPSVRNSGLGRETA